MASGDAKKAAARPAFERVIERLVVDENGCWLWPGATAGPATHKYGMVQTGSRSDGTRRTVAVHRVVWEHFVGPIAGELDHLCRVTLCANPGHLEDVTHQVNMSRMVITDSDRERRRRHAEWMRVRRQELAS